MRRSAFMVSILLAFLVSLALGMNTASAAVVNCEDLALGPGHDGRTYSCEAMDETGITSSFTLAVSNDSPDFQGLVESADDSTATLICACKAKGGFPDTTRFKVSRELQCLAVGGSLDMDETLTFNYSTAGYEGEVKKGGRAIDHGQASDHDGNSIIFNCTAPAM
ncbi:MAG: hypothetical protein HY268_12020 [Deltaproteobacteria bacterium]|nr:hypothetical protein [Deltaproteobacteria bacterium]